MLCGAMPAVTGLNHVTLAVGDLDRSITFYRDLLGFALRAVWADGAYLEAGSLWLTLAREDQADIDPRADYSHIALSVSAGDFTALAGHVRTVSTIWKENRSEGNSLYFLDPDGHKLELHVGSLETRLDHYRKRTDGKVTII